MHKRRPFFRWQWEQVQPSESGITPGRLTRDPNSPRNINSTLDRNTTAPHRPRTLAELKSGLGKHGIGFNRNEFEFECFASQIVEGDASAPIPKRLII